jgi:putative flippase GtrA
MRPGAQQFQKYLLVGVANLAFTFLVYFYFLRILQLHYLAAFSLSWAAGLLFTYIVNYLWVFKPESTLTFRGRFTKYATVYLSSFLLNLVSLKALKEALDVDPLIIQLFLLPMVVIINFCGMKFWSLKIDKEGD